MKKKINSFFLLSIIAIALLVALAVIFFPRRSPPPSTANKGYPPQALTEGMISTHRSQTLIPARTIQPTVNPLTHIPPTFWPTNEPWPPLTSTPKPYITSTIEPFPTLQFSLLDEKTADDALDSLWYPYRIGKNADVVLEEIKIDEKARRKEKPNTRIDLGFGYHADYPRILFLKFSPDRTFFSFFGADREGGNWTIYETSKGNRLEERKFGFIAGLFDWSPDGKYFLAHIALDDNETGASRVEIVSGARLFFKFTDLDGIVPRLDDMAFSPDGNMIAASLTYQPYSGKNNPWVKEISLWKSDDPSSREILCQVVNGKSSYPQTLQWSPDGEKLLWVGGLEIPGEEDWVEFLWLADRSTGKCEPVANLGESHGVGYATSGEFPADWSADGSQIVFLIIEEKEGVNSYRIVIMDVKTGKTKDLIKPSENILTHVQYSPNGNWIVYSIRKGYYGEIWVTSLDGQVSRPIAGPTTIDAPFWWEKKPITPAG